MKRTTLLISVLLSISTIGCSGSNHEAAFSYKDFISHKAPIDNSKVELPDNFLTKLDSISIDQNDQYVGVNYEEYYSSKYDECIRLYENNSFLYYSPLGAKSSYYDLKDNFLTVCFNFASFTIYDSFLFYVKDNKILNLDKLSVSNSGFSFNGREFIHREKEQPIISKYLYAPNEKPSYHIGLTLLEILPQDELLEKFDIVRYKDNIQSFFNFESINKTSIEFIMTDFSHLLEDINCFYRLNEKYRFDNFIYEISNSFSSKKINIAYYSLTENDALKDYQYYGYINSFLSGELKELDDVDRLFTTKQELVDLIEPIKDNNLGNFADVKKLANEVTDDMFTNYYLLMTRVVFNATYVVRPFDGLYYANNDFHLVLQPASSGYQAITQVCYVFFIPKNMTFQKINIYY